MEKYSPRAVVLCFGAEAAEYRKEAYPAYHAERPDMPGTAGVAVVARRGPV